MTYDNLLIISVVFKYLGRDWLALVPPTAIAAGFTYMAYRAFCPEAHPKSSSVVNPTILKKNEKVVDTIDVEDISEKAVFCRCWRSKNVSTEEIIKNLFIHKLD